MLQCITRSSHQLRCKLKRANTFCVAKKRVTTSVTWWRLFFFLVISWKCMLRTFSTKEYSTMVDSPLIMKKDAFLKPLRRLLSSWITQSTIESWKSNLMRNTINNTRQLSSSIRRGCNKYWWIYFPMPASTRLRERFLLRQGFCPNILTKRQGLSLKWQLRTMVLVLQSRISKIFFSHLECRTLEE